MCAQCDLIPRHYWKGIDTSKYALWTQFEFPRSDACLQLLLPQLITFEPAPLVCSYKNSLEAIEGFELVISQLQTTSTYGELGQALASGSTFTNHMLSVEPCISLLFSCLVDTKCMARLPRISSQQSHLCQYQGSLCCFCHLLRCPTRFGGVFP